MPLHPDEDNEGLLHRVQECPVCGHRTPEHPVWSAALTVALFLALILCLLAVGIVAVVGAYRYVSG